MAHSPAPGESVADRKSAPAADPRVEKGVVIDLARHRVLVDNRDARLTFKEFSLVQALVGGETLSRTELRRRIATSDDEEVTDRSIDVHIRRLRIKFGPYPELIRTVHGRGYFFDGGHDVVVLGDSATPPG